MFKIHYKFSLPTLITIMAVVIASCSSMQESTVQSTERHTLDKDQPTVPLQELKRPVPNSIEYEIPDRFKQAVKNGTRTADGKPGADYWQQYSSYDIDVKVLPEKKELRATGTIVYQNNSPNALNNLYLELDMNLRNGAQVQDGIKIERLAYNDQQLSETTNYETGYAIDGTLMKVNLPKPLKPNSSATIQIEWSFSIPQTGGGGRMGYSQDNFFFIGYWYPQMRVYDDVIGWFTAPFTGMPEFYHGFADYEVSITVPDQWIVTATGKATNRKRLLQKDVYNRLMNAYNGTDIVRVVGPNDFGDVTVEADDGWLTWDFTASKVTDFAFSITKESIWEATTTPVGDRDGDGNTDYVHINSFFRTLAPLWDDAARYTQHAIKFLSKFTGLSYPWPHMTSVEGAGIIGGGMEYPMMTIIGPYNSNNAQPSDLYSVIAHELAHMWVPMQLSTNERRYAWMDEGTTTFNEGQAQQAFPLAPEFKSEIADFKSYLRIAGTDREAPMIRWSGYYYMPGAYGVASYPKPASVLVALRGVLGQEQFRKAYRVFMDRWRFKHPYPWDLFSTFEDVTDRNLDWFWRSWYYTTWVVDQAVADVEPTQEGTNITIKDLGNVPMPASIKVWLSNGETVIKQIDVKTWLQGAVKTTLFIEAGAEVTKVVIDPEHQFPDANRKNNVWAK